MIESHRRWRTELLGWQKSGKGLEGGKYRADEPACGKTLVPTRDIQDQCAGTQGSRWESRQQAVRAVNMLTSAENLS